MRGKLSIYFDHCCRRVAAGTMSKPALSGLDKYTASNCGYNRFPSPRMSKKTVMDGGQMP